MSVPKYKIFVLVIIEVVLEFELYVFLRELYTNIFVYHI